MSSVRFRDKIEAALVHSLHNDAGYGLSFIEKFKDFQDDLQRTEDWEMELAIREVYKGPRPFVWTTPFDDDAAFPVASPEYEEHYDWCAEIQDLCLFIKNIEEYID